MLSDSKKKLFSYVIVWKIDRFGRNREDIAKNKALLRLNGVKLLSAKEAIPEGPEGIILEAVLEGLAEYYSANLSQNIKRGMSEAVMKGKYAGSSLPLGYYVDENNYLQINIAEANAVRKAFEMFNSGKSYTQIAEYLNDSGFKTSRGAAFNCNTVKAMLKNRKYIGEYIWANIKAEIPQIIDTDLFNKVQKDMENKTIKSRRCGNVDFLLTGKLFCGHCKSPMSGDSGTSVNGERYYYYSCRGKKIKKICKKKSVKKDWIEKKVIYATVDYVLKDEAIELIAEKVLEAYQKKLSENIQEKRLKKQISEVEKALKNIMRAIESGIFNETTKNRMDELEKEKDRLNIELAKEKINTENKLTKDHIIFYLLNFKKDVSINTEFLKKLIEMFIDSIYLYDDKLLINYKIDDKADSSAIVELVDAKNENIFSCEKVRIKSKRVDQKTVLMYRLFSFHKNKTGAVFEVTPKS